MTTLSNIKAVRDPQHPEQLTVSWDGVSDSGKWVVSGSLWLSSVTTTANTVTRKSFISSTLYITISDNLGYSDYIVLPPHSSSFVSNITYQRKADRRYITLTWDGVLDDASLYQQRYWKVRYKAWGGYGVVETYTALNTLVIDLSPWQDHTITIDSTNDYADSQVENSIVIPAIAGLMPTWATMHSVSAVYNSDQGSMEFNALIEVENQDCLVKTPASPYDLFYPRVNINLLFSKTGSSDEMLYMAGNYFGLVIENNKIKCGPVYSSIPVDSNGWFGKAIVSLSDNWGNEETVVESLSLPITGGQIVYALSSFELVCDRNILIRDAYNTPRFYANRIGLNIQWENPLYTKHIEIESRIDNSGYIPLMTVSDNRDYVQLHYENNFAPESNQLQIKHHFVGFDGTQKADYSGYRDHYGEDSNATLSQYKCELLHDVQLRYRLEGDTEWVYSNIIEQIGLRSPLYPNINYTSLSFPSFIITKNPTNYINYFSGTHDYIDGVHEYFDKEVYEFAIDLGDFIEFDSCSYVALFNNGLNKTLVTHCNWWGRTLAALSGNTQDQLGNLTSIHKNLIESIDNLRQIYYNTLVAEGKSGPQIAALLNEYMHVICPQQFNLINYFNHKPEFINRNYTCLPFIDKSLLDGKTHIIKYRITRYLNNNKIAEFNYPYREVVLPDITTRINRQALFESIYKAPYFKINNNDVEILFHFKEYQSKSTESYIDGQFVYADPNQAFVEFMPENILYTDIVDGNRRIKHESNYNYFIDSQFMMQNTQGATWTQMNFNRASPFSDSSNLTCVLHIRNDDGLVAFDIGYGEGTINTYHAITQDMINNKKEIVLTIPYQGFVLFKSDHDISNNVLSAGYTGQVYYNHELSDACLHMRYQYLNSSTFVKTFMTNIYLDGVKKQRITTQDQYLHANMQIVDLDRVFGVVETFSLDLTTNTISSAFKVSVLNTLFRGFGALTKHQSVQFALLRDGQEITGTGYARASVNASDTSFVLKSLLVGNTFDRFSQSIANRVSITFPEVQTDWVGVDGIGVYVNNTLIAQSDIQHTFIVGERPVIAYGNFTINFI